MQENKNITLYDPQVSIIIRTANEKRLPLLRSAINSILDNNYNPFEIIIVVQSINNQFIKDVKNLSDHLVSQKVECQVIVNCTSKDERAKNLNLGIKAAKGEYIGFLDDDDIFYPNHLPLLVKALEENQDYSWAFSDVKLAFVSIDKNSNLDYLDCEYRFKQEKYSFENLLKSNFIPLHSYLLNRNKINVEYLLFDESFTFAEDYLFLLNLASKYTPFYLQEVTCEYRIFQDFTNTNLIMNDLINHPDIDKIRNWNKALWRIEKRKKELHPSYSSGLISLELRKYIFYRFPILKIILQHRFPKLRKFLLFLLRIKS